MEFSVVLPLQDDTLFIDHDIHELQFRATDRKVISWKKNGSISKQERQSSSDW